VCKTLKVKSEIRNQWLNCSNGSKKRKLRKNGNEYSSEIVRKWLVCATARNLRTSGAVVQGHAKMLLKSWGNVNLGYLMDDQKVSERHIKLCLTKSVEKLGCLCRNCSNWFAKIQVPTRKATCLQRKKFRCLAVP
jgi:hypothetical protein